MQRFKKWAMPKANTDAVNQPIVFGAPYGWPLAHPQACMFTGKFIDMSRGTRYRDLLIFLQRDRRNDVLGIDHNAGIRTPLSCFDTHRSHCRIYARMAASMLP